VPPRTNPAVPSFDACAVAGCGWTGDGSATDGYDGQPMTSANATHSADAAMTMTATRTVQGNFSTLGVLTNVAICWLLSPLERSPIRCVPLDPGPLPCLGALVGRTTAFQKGCGRRPAPNSSPRKANFCDRFKSRAACWGGSAAHAVGKVHRRAYLR